MDQQRETLGRRRGNHRNSPIRFVVFAVFAAAVILGLRSEIPAFSDWIDRFVQPPLWQARQTCQKAALAESSSPSTARILLHGEVAKTQQGFLVSGVLIGEMGPDGNERDYSFTCYTDGEGKLIRGSKQP